MKTIIGSSLLISDPIPEINQWISENLTFPNPEFIKKERMNLWLGGTPRYLYLYERIPVNKVRIPYGCLKTILPLLRKGDIELAFEKHSPVEYNADFGLYDYQKKALIGMLSNYYGILQANPGAGKTQIGLAIITSLKARALWLTHTKDLLNQSKRTAERYIDPKLLGTITEGKVNIGDGITFATVQTLAKLDLKQYENMWDVIIVDECHNVAGTPTAVTMFYKVLNNLAAIHKYGLSATVHRSDGLIGTTKAIIGDVAYVISKQDIGDKIVDVGVYPIATGLEPDYMSYDTDGTLNYARLLKWMVTCEERNQIIIDTLLSQKIRPSLILTDRLEHINLLVDMLPEEVRKQTVWINASTNQVSRINALEYMRSGRKKILIATYGLAKEGLDIPCLERLYLATPHRDYAVITQAVGRIARSSPNKEPPIVIDFVDNSKYLQNSYKSRKSIYKKNGCYFTDKLT